MNSANPPSPIISRTPGPSQPAASQNRSAANVAGSLATANRPTASSTHENASSHLTDGSQRYNLRSATQTEAQDVATTTATSRPAAVAVHNDTMQSRDGFFARAARAQVEADLRVIQERVARNNGSTREDIEAAGTMLEMARQAEIAEQELARRRGWRKD